MARWIDWLLLGVRLLILAMASKPIADKFFDYPGQVVFFESLGIPQPAIMVLVAGVVELTAALMLLLGVGARVGGLMLVPVMLVAIVTYGPSPPAIVVLLGAIAIAVFGPGRYALWRPEERLLARWRREPERRPAHEVTRPDDGAYSGDARPGAPRR